MNNKKFLTVQDMVLIAVFVAIITVCSFIQISVGPVPFTLQTFGVFVTAGILGTKRGTLAVIVWCRRTGSYCWNNRWLHNRICFYCTYYWHNHSFLWKEFYMVKTWSYSCSYDFRWCCMFCYWNNSVYVCNEDFIDSGIGILCNTIYYSWFS